MKPAPSSASFNVGSNVRLNVGSLVPFWKSAISTETWRVLYRGLHRASRHKVRPAEQRENEHGCRHDEARSHAPHERERLAVLIEAIEIGRQIARRLIALGGIRIEAARDQPVDRFRNRRVDRSHRWWRMLHAPLELFKGVSRGSFASAKQHVREDQSERVEIGALIDGFALGLLRRHVLDRSEDGSRHRDVRRRSGRGSAGAMQRRVWPLAAMSCR